MHDIDSMSAADVIKALDLAPHPEGGHYRETFRDPAAVGGRSVGTAIYFLLDVQVFEVLLRFFVLFLFVLFGDARDHLLPALARDAVTPTPAHRRAAETRGRAGRHAGTFEDGAFPAGEDWKTW